VARWQLRVSGGLEAVDVRSIAGKRTWRDSDGSASQVKAFFPCSETVGLGIRDEVAGIIHQPFQLISIDGDPCDGELQFVIPHAVRIINNSADKSTPLAAGAWPALDSSKVFANVAIFQGVHLQATWQCKHPIGNTVSGTGISLSWGGNSLHSLMATTDGTAIAGSDGTGVGFEEGVTKISYVVWDGVNEVLIAKLMNADGTVLQSMSDAGTQTGAWTPSASTRVTDVDLFCWAVYQWDTLPANLDAGLVAMCANVTNGKKEPYVF
jgi:hypothetical protein